MSDLEGRDLPSAQGHLQEKETLLRETAPWISGRIMPRDLSVLVDSDSKDDKIQHLDHFELAVSTTGAKHGTDIEQESFREIDKSARNTVRAALHKGAPHPSGKCAGYPDREEAFHCLHAALASRCDSRLSGVKYALS